MYRPWKLQTKIHGWSTHDLPLEITKENTIGLVGLPPQANPIASRASENSRPNPPEENNAGAISSLPLRHLGIRNSRGAVYDSNYEKS